MSLEVKELVWGHTICFCKWFVCRKVPYDFNAQPRVVRKWARREDVSQHAVLTIICSFQLDYLLVTVRYFIVCKIKPVILTYAWYNLCLGLNSTLRPFLSPMIFPSYKQRPPGGPFWLRSPKLLGMWMLSYLCPQQYPSGVCSGGFVRWGDVRSILLSGLPRLTLSPLYFSHEEVEVSELTI